MKLTRGVLFFLLFLITINIIRAQQPAASPTPEEWQRYELGNGAYSVLLPSKPNEVKNPSTPEVSEMWVATVSASNYIFVSQYAKFTVSVTQSPDLIATFYDGAWKGIREEFDKQAEESKTPKVTVRDQKDTTFRGRAAREINFSIGPLFGKVVMTVKEQHAYIVMVMRKDQASLAAEEKFLGSFNLKLPATLMQHHPKHKSN
jgi:hypothetical protein